MPNSIGGAPKKNFMDQDPFTGEDFSNKTSAKADATDGNKEDRKHSNDNSVSGKQANGSGGSGWFGGIWNRLSMKPKNQMILPDDKNPTVRIF